MSKKYENTTISSPKEFDSDSDSDVNNENLVIEDDPMEDYPALMTNPDIESRHGIQMYLRNLLGYCAYGDGSPTKSRFENIRIEADNHGLPNVVTFVDDEYHDKEAICIACVVNHPKFGNIRVNYISWQIMHK
jgi:hypothetical protein